MITAIIIIGLAFYWLLIETDCMRVRLPVGAATPVIKIEPKFKEIVCKHGKTHYDDTNWKCHELPVREIIREA